MAEHAHQPCPYQSCGSSDAFSYNTEGYGKCHACNRSYPSNGNMYEWAKDKYPTKERDDYMSFTPKLIEDVSDGEYVNMRGINTKTMEDFGVLTWMTVKSTYTPAVELRFVNCRRKVSTLRQVSKVMNSSV